jgi:nucleotide-binding universal stress UspA family protein
MKLLICSDGSPQAEQAVRLGTAIAAGCQSEVVLLGIIESPGQSQAILDSLKRGQAALEDKKIHAELVTKAGKPLGEIVRRTQEAHYDLVIIGAVRKNGGGAFRVSSTAYKIVKKIAPPVLIVSGQQAAIRRILICSGGQRQIENGVRLGGEIARGFGATVNLLHVMPEPPALYSGLSRVVETPAWLLNSKSELGLNLRHWKEALQSQGVTAEVVLRQGSVLEQILHEIAEGEYDMVVTGSALSRGLRTYVLGDISREIMNRAACAVLVVRSQEKARHGRSPLKGLLGRLAPREDMDPLNR